MTAMPETITIPVELPKELVTRIKMIKPAWLVDLSDEQFLGHVIAHGDFDTYLGQIQKANQQVQSLTAELHLEKAGPTGPKRAKTLRRESNSAGNAAGEKPPVPS